MSFLIARSPRLERADPVDRPLIPSAYDDEFESNVLDGSWTRVGIWDDVNAIDPGASFNNTGTRWSLNGSVAGTGRRSWMMLQADPTWNNTIRKAITYPSEYFIWARLSFNYLNAGQVNNDSNIRLNIGEPVSGHYIDIALNESDGNTVQVEFSYNQGTPTTIALSNNVGGIGNTGGQAGHIVGIQRLSGTYHGWFMSAAGNWIWMGSQVYTGNAPTHADLRFQTTTAANNAIGGFDFIRYKAGRFLP